MINKEKSSFLSDLDFFFSRALNGLNISNNERPLKIISRISKYYNEELKNAMRQRGFYAGASFLYPDSWGGYGHHNHL